MDATDEELNLDAPALRRRLRELREEIRLKLHLAGMDARDAFEALEREADHVIHEVPGVDHRALVDVAARLRKLADELRAH